MSSLVNVTEQQIKNLTERIRRECRRGLSSDLPRLLVERREAMAWLEKYKQENR